MSGFIIVINIGVLFFISFYLFRTSHSFKNIFWPALAIKLLAGIVLGLLYTYYYPGGDTFSIFEDAKLLSGFARGDLTGYFKFLWASNDTYPLWDHLSVKEPRALFLTKIISIICLFTYDNYWIVSLYFSLLSFACSWKFVNTILKYFKPTKDAAVLSFLFIPSVVFWGSGIIKECIALASLLFLSHIFLIVWFKDKLKLTEWVLAILFLWILCQIKYYYAAAFVSVTITTILVKFILLPLLKPKYAIVKIIIWFVVYIAPLFLLSLTIENFHPHMFFNVVIKNYHTYLHLSKPNGAVHFAGLEPTFWSFIYHSPKALLTGLFRPFIWEANNGLSILMSLENMVLLFLIIASVVNCRNFLYSQHRLLIFSVIVYVFLLCVFLTLSTPNFGTISRYRISFLPFLYFLVMINNPVIVFLTRIIQTSFSRLVR